MQNTAIFHTANILSILSETFLLLYYAKSLLILQPRKKIYIIAAYLLLSYGHFLINASGVKQINWLLGVLLALAVDAVLIFALFIGPPRSKARLIILYYLMISSIEFVVAATAHLYIPGYSAGTTQENTPDAIVLAVIIRVIQYGVLILFLHLKKRDPSSKPTVGFAITPIISIAVFWLLYPFGWRLQIDEVDVLLAIFAMVLLFLNAYILMCCHAIRAQSARYTQLSAAYHAQREYSLSQTEVNRAIRKMAHDARHHYSYLATAIQKAEDGKALAYIDELQEHINTFFPKRITGNDDIDALLTAKIVACEQKGIALAVSGFLPNAIPFSAVDISILLGNALDNAIDATYLVCGSRLSDTPIEVSLSFSMFRLGIHVRNPYCHSLVALDNGQYYSQKHGGAGLGIEIMGDVVRKYDGAMLVSTADDVFELTILLNGNEGLC